MPAGKHYSRAYRNRKVDAGFSYLAFWVPDKVRDDLHDQASAAGITVAELCVSRLTGQPLPKPRNGGVKLDAAKAFELWQRAKAGESLAALAEESGVSRGLVWQIAAGRRWKRVIERMSANQQEQQA